MTLKFRLVKLCDQNLSLKGTKHAKLLIIKNNKKWHKIFLFVCFFFSQFVCACICLQAWFVSEECVPRYIWRAYIGMIVFPNLLLFNLPMCSKPEHNHQLEFLQSLLVLLMILDVNQVCSNDIMFHQSWNNEVGHMIIVEQKLGFGSLFLLEIVKVLSPKKHGWHLTPFSLFYHFQHSYGWLFSLDNHFQSNLVALLV